MVNVAQVKERPVKASKGKWLMPVMRRSLLDGFLSHTGQKELLFLNVLE